MKISRLRLSGFKSFVDPTELVIEPGLTGIVGPNGCGKSNLLEALRWVMGENSPKSMRGAGMEDVIFAGTSARPMRNMAEVVLVLDNAERNAPAAYNEHEALEVSRRIEREAGSVYRVNGREARQRDVHLLFADASTGAHSPALVRQGQIGQIINAKPIARRAILEEAAGISGLHSRRHEAELRLKAAETNLTRLTDVLQELEGQLRSLKSQARQATRYKNISGQIRRLEALAHHLRWAQAGAQAAFAEAELAEAQARAAHATEAAARAATAQAEAQSALPPLRDAEAAKAAALQRLTHEKAALQREEEQAKAAAERLAARIAQTEADIERERHRADDARAMIAKLAEERAALIADAEGSETREAQARDALGEAEAALHAHEAAHDAKSAEAAALAARAKALGDLTDQAQARLSRAESGLLNLVRERDAINAEIAALPDIAAARGDAEAREAARDDARRALGEAEQARAAALAQEQAARDALSPLDRHADRLKAEAATLAKLLKAGTPDLFPPLIDSLKVAPGYEAALGAALGEDLVAPLDEAAPIHWRLLPDYDEAAALPSGATPLSTFVEAPPALKRRLTQIGIVAPEDGPDLQSALKPGQILVSTFGAVWRWDGLTAIADAPTAAAVRLSQRNRLAELDGEVARADADARAARTALDAARNATSLANDGETAARAAARAADEALDRARAALARIEREAAQASLKLSAADEGIARLETQRDDAARELAAATGERDQLPDGEALKAEIVALREAVLAARALASEARAAAESVKREAEARARRLSGIESETQEWERRTHNADTQIAHLAERRDRDVAEREALLLVPGEIESKRLTLLEAIAGAEHARQTAADALAEAEQILAAADRTAKHENAQLSEAREARARMEAVLDGARARLAEVAQAAREQMDCQPTELLAKAELKDGEELPSLEETDTKVEKLKRERESLGGVNLRAEEEAQEAQTRLDQMTAEKADLEGAIAKLRGGISSLNREGRERLLSAFDTVNAHFKRLFATLFGGGEAELTLVESEDPLEAGLEILARPPGKKLTSISLLSGGEQALTAMSLIFAVFLSNPAPICVLDEVDAPLDDANVERFCNLLEEMVRTTDTRFLIITHHALTMARMHRLFGVTMAERGVSQLVSVDLEAAERVLAAE